MGVLEKYALGGIIILLAALVLVGLSAGGCRPNVDATTYQIGIISGAGIFDTTVDGLRSGLEDLGYREDEVLYDFRQAGGDYEQMVTIAQGFVAGGVDVMFTTTNNAALAAKKSVAGTDVPVVFTFVIAPVETGVVDNLRQPGGNLTGVRNPLDVFIGKRIEFAQMIVPDLHRVWVPYDPQYPTVIAVLDQLRAAAPILEVELLESPVGSPAAVLRELESYGQMDKVPFDAVIVFPDLTVQQEDSWNAILRFADEHGLPILANTPGQVEAGALLGYMADNVATGRQAAHLVDLVLKGESPANLPVETAEQYLHINLETARRLGCEVPNILIRQADVVIR